MRYLMWLSRLIRVQARCLWWDWWGSKTGRHHPPAFEWYVLACYRRQRRVQRTPPRVRHATRRRVRRAFARWLQHNHHRLRFPARLGRRGPKLVLHWVGVPDSVYSSLDDCCVQYVVTDFYESSSHFWAHAVCDGVARGSRRRWGATYPVWPSFEAFWADEVFEPWLRNVNASMMADARRAILRGDAESAARGPAWMRAHPAAGGVLIYGLGEKQRARHVTP